MVNKLQFRISLVLALLMVGFGVMGQGVQTPKASNNEDTGGGNPDEICVYHCESVQEEAKIGAYIKGYISDLVFFSTVVLKLEVFDLKGDLIDSYVANIPLETLSNAEQGYCCPSGSGYRPYYDYNHSFGTFSTSGIYEFVYTLSVSTHDGRVNHQQYAFVTRVLGNESGEGEKPIKRLASQNHNTLLKAYPNPVSNNLTLEYWLDNDELAQIVIYNSLGREVLKLNASNKNRQHVDMNELDEGIYIIKLQIGDRVNTLRVLKR